MLVWLGVLLAAWLLAWEPRALGGVTPKPTLLLGHRGVRATPEDNLPENSVAAFQAALDAGLDGVETDLQRSCDGHLVLVHDPTLPDGRSVASLTCAELQAADPNVTTLAALFMLARGYPGTLLNLELKTTGWRTGGLERAAAGAVRDSGLTDRILVSSFNPLSLLRLRLHAPELRVALIYSLDSPRWLRTNYSARIFARLLHLDALHPHFSLVNAPLRHWAGRRGVMLSAWTVNDPREVERLTRLNVNGLMADSPASLKDAFKEALWRLEEQTRRGQ